MILPVYITPSVFGLKGFFYGHVAPVVHWVFLISFYPTTRQLRVRLTTYKEEVGQKLYFSAGHPGHEP